MSGAGVVLPRGISKDLRGRIGRSLLRCGCCLSGSLLPELLATGRLTLLRRLLTVRGLSLLSGWLLGRCSVLSLRLFLFGSRCRIIVLGAFCSGALLGVSRDWMPLAAAGFSPSLCSALR